MSEEPEERTVTHVFTIQGRPVGYRPAYFGGDLVAIERGFFPVSCTGYRSLAGHFGFERHMPASGVPPELLEGIAAEQDKERRATIKRVQRFTPPGPDRVSNYIGASGDASKAFEDGFFAPDADRVALWQGAFRKLHLIDTDPRFQPVSTGHQVWNDEHCAAALAKARALLDFLKQVATGSFPAEAPEGMLTFHAYFELPPKPDGEPVIELPAITEEFALGLSVQAQREEEEESADEEPEEDEQADQSTQLSLF